MAKDVQEINRIVYIEPNEFAEMSQKAENGVSRDNIAWNPEDLQYTVDLRVEIASRFDEMKSGEVPTSINEQNSDKNEAKWISFMSGEELGTDTDGAAINCLTDAYTNISYTEYTSTGKSSRELLGIDSIDIDFSSHFYPQVKMRMTDVRGASLFQPAELNYQFDEIDGNKNLSDDDKNAAKRGVKTANLSQGFFKTLFHFPYPKFLLTLKGFYGDKVTFVLSVSDFKSAFNAQTGNFDVEISFIGYMYGMYTDIPMNLIFTAPYYNKEYWDKRATTDGTFTYYDGKPMMTFPKFLDKYAHLLENIKSSEIGSHENIVKLKALTDERATFEDLQRKYKTTVGHVFQTNAVKEIAGDTHNTFVYKSKERSVKFENWESVIETFNNAYNDAKEKYPELVSEVQDFSSFPSKDGDITMNEPLKEGKDFNPKFKDANLLGYETKSLEALQAYAERNDGVVCVYVKGNFETKLQERIDKLTDEIKTLKETTDEEISEIITKAMDFKLSVENVYRMIFAHIETFVNSFVKCTNNIEKKRNSGNLRTVGYLGLNREHSDLPKRIDDNTYVPPFPAVLDDNRKMIFPGNSNNTVLRQMDEVEYVDNIVKSIKDYVTEAEKAISFLNEQKASEPNGNSDFKLTFDPISVADIFYAMNGENPYQFLYEYMRQDTHGVKAEYILYFIYCRVLTAYAVEKNVLDSGDRSIYKRICEKEVNNCLKYFESMGYAFDDVLKSKILEYTKEITDKNGDVSTSKIVTEFGRKFGNKIYPITNDNNRFDNIDYLLYFTNPFNRNDNKKGYLFKNDSILKEININEKTASDFGSKIDEAIANENGKVIIGYSPDNTPIEGNTYTFDTDLYSEKNDKYCYTRIRNGENFNKKGKYFILSNNETINTKNESQIPNVNKEKYVNLNVEKDSENLKTTFIGMRDAYTNNGSSVLKDYYTGLLSYGDFTADDENATAESLYMLPYTDKNGLIRALLDSENTEDVADDCMAAILTLAAMASYFNATTENYYLSRLIYDFTKCGDNLVTLPKILVLYYGSLHYLYSNFDQFGQAKSIIDDYIHPAVYKFTFGNPNIKKDDKTTWLDLIDIHGNVLEKNMSLSATYVHLFRNESEDSLNTFYKYAETEFINWLGSDDWKNLRGKLLDTGEKNNSEKYYYGKIKDKNSDFTKEESFSILLWKHNSDADNIIKEELCKVRQLLFIKGSEKNNVALDNKHMNTLMSVINNAFTEYKTEGDRAAEDMNGSGDKTNTEEESCALYYTLKNLYDRWFASGLADGSMVSRFHLNVPETDRGERNTRQSGEKNNLRTEFNSFLYVNSFYKDISSQYIINPDILVDCVKNYISNGKINKNDSVYEFMSEVAEKNRLLMLALPVYNNFYNLENIKSIFTPNVLYSQKNVSKDLGIGNTYLIMYTGNVSNKLGDNDGDYQDDAPDLFGMYENHDPDTYKLFAYDDKSGDGTIENGESNGQFTVPAFGVTYAKQNQMYFKNISINMDNPQVTDYSLANLIQISYGGAHGDVNQRFGVGQNIYSIYANRSYTCTVEMMGCMNIMPSMYFQLNNIPMFRGLYYIIKVSHSVRAGDITTKFMGVRINKNQLADVKIAFDFQSIYDKINSMSFGETTVSGGSGIQGNQQTDFDKITIENLVYSDTAVAKGINNEPTIEDAKHLELVVEFVNDLAEAWGRGVKVSSGYRSNALNEAVGGSKTSAHSHGYAVDLLPKKNSDNTEFKKYVLEFLLTSIKWKNNFDQFIHENKKNGSSWAHVGLRNNAGGKRKQLLYYNQAINSKNYYQLIYEQGNDGKIEKMWYVSKDGKTKTLINN